MNDLLQIPLGLADVRVLETRQTRSGEWVIRLESTLDHTVCRCCGREIHDAYGHDRPIRLRHLPILDQEVYLELRPRRFRCRYCDDHPTSTQRLDWYEPNRPYTRAFERLMLRELINSTLSDVARKQGLSAEMATTASTAATVPTSSTAAAAATACAVVNRPGNRGGPLL